MLEYTARDLAREIYRQYDLGATFDGKTTGVNGSMRVPGQVHTVNLVLHRRGSARTLVMATLSAMSRGKFAIPALNAAGEYTLQNGSHAKLCGQGPRAEAKAARPLPARSCMQRLPNCNGRDAFTLAKM